MDVEVGVEDVVDVGDYARGPDHPAAVGLEGLEHVGHVVGDLHPYVGGDVDVRLPDGSRERLARGAGAPELDACEGVPGEPLRVRGAYVDHVGSDAKLGARVEGDALGVLLEQAVRALVAEALGVAVHVEHLAPWVRLEEEVEVMLVQGRVVQQVAVGQSRSEDVVTDAELPVAVLEASRELGAQRQHHAAPRAAARGIKRAQLEEQPRAAGATRRRWQIRVRLNQLTNLQRCGRRPALVPDAIDCLSVVHGCAEQVDAIRALGQRPPLAGALDHSSHVPIALARGGQVLARASRARIDDAAALQLVILCERGAQAEEQKTATPARHERPALLGGRRASMHSLHEPYSECIRYIGT